MATSKACMRQLDADVRIGAAEVRDDIAKLTGTELARRLARSHAVPETSIWSWLNKAQLLAVFRDLSRTGIDEQVIKNHVLKAYEAQVTTLASRHSKAVNALDFMKAKDLEKRVSAARIKLMEARIKYGPPPPPPPPPVPRMFTNLDEFRLRRWTQTELYRLLSENPDIPESGIYSWMKKDELIEGIKGLQVDASIGAKNALLLKAYAARVRVLEQRLQKLGPTDVAKADKLVIEIRKAKDKFEAKQASLPLRVPTPADLRPPVPLPPPGPGFTFDKEIEIPVMVKDEEGIVRIPGELTDAEREVVNNWIVETGRAGSVIEFGTSSYHFRFATAPRGFRRMDAKGIIRIPETIDAFTPTRSGWAGEVETIRHRLSMKTGSLSVKEGSVVERERLTREAGKLIDDEIIRRAEALLPKPSPDLVRLNRELERILEEMTRLADRRTQRAAVLSREVEARGGRLDYWAAFNADPQYQEVERQVLALRQTRDRLLDQRRSLERTSGVGMFPKSALREARIKATDEVLRETREFGGGNWLVRDDPHAASQIKDRLEEAQKEALRFPTDWRDQVSSLRIDRTEKKRAFYRRYERTAFIRRHESPSVILHEMTHHMEYEIPGISAATKEFLQRRYARRAPKWLGSGFRRDEVGVPDEFNDRYIGKWYSSEATEVLTMGIEGVYHGRHGFWGQGFDPALRTDPDLEYRNLILGLLAVM